MTTIDIHLHVMSTDTPRHPLMPLRGTQSNWSRDRPTPFEKLLEAMDAASIDKAAVVQASTTYGHNNSYLAEAIAAYPTRFTGVFSVDASASDAVEKMRYWLDRGFSGRRLFTTGSTMPGQATWFDDPRSFSTWEYASNIGIPVCMQMTREGFPQLRRILNKFPNVKIILDHCAGAPSHRRRTVRGRSTLVRCRRLSRCLSEDYAEDLCAAPLGKANAATFFRKLEFSGDRRSTRRDPLQGADGSTGLGCGRSRVDLRQDGADTLPHSQRLKDPR
jgi:predicted TIM-barrel fold metal-dependent hydrolase